MRRQAQARAAAALQREHRITLAGHADISKNAADQRYNTKLAEDLAKFDELVATADVFIQNFRPGVAERLGLGPADCHARNPRLVYGRMTGFGQSGPLAQAAGHDLNYIALTGALHAIGTGGPGGKPVPPLNLVADFGGGAMFLVFEILVLALRDRLQETASTMRARHTNLE